MLTHEDDLKFLFHSAASVCCCMCVTTIKISKLGDKIGFVLSGVNDNIYYYAYEICVFILRSYLGNAKLIFFVYFIRVCI